MDLNMWKQNTTSQNNDPLPNFPSFLAESSLRGLYENTFSLELPPSVGSCWHPASLLISVCGYWKKLPKLLLWLNDVHFPFYWNELFNFKVRWKKKNWPFWINCLFIYSLCWLTSFRLFRLNKCMEIAPPFPPSLSASPPTSHPPALVCFCMAPGCLEAVCICMGEMVDRDGIWHAGTRSKRSIWSHKNPKRALLSSLQNPHW